MLIYIDDMLIVGTVEAINEMIQILVLSTTEAEYVAVSEVVKEIIPTSAIHGH